jgi:hypothetical protein
VTEINTYQGKVVEHTPPKGGGPHKFSIAQVKDGIEKSRKFRVWATDYKTKEPNLDLKKLLGVLGTNALVSVSFYTKQEEWNDKTFPANYVTDVEFVGGEDAPAQPEPAAPQDQSVLNVLEGALQDANAALTSAFAALKQLNQLKGAADAAPADDGW